MYIGLISHGELEKPSFKLLIILNYFDRHSIQNSFVIIMLSYLIVLVPPSNLFVLIPNLVVIIVTVIVTNTGDLTADLALHSG